jgi:hypothetical protein
LLQVGVQSRGIEHQHDVLLPLELVEAELGSRQVTGKLEVRRLFADFNHDDFPPKKI